MTPFRRLVVLTVVLFLVLVAPVAADQFVTSRVNHTFNCPDAWGVTVPIPAGATEIIGWHGLQYVAGAPATTYVGFSLWHHRTVSHELFFTWITPPPTPEKVVSYTPPKPALGHSAIPGDIVWFNAWCGGSSVGTSTITVLIEFRVP